MDCWHQLSATHCCAAFAAVRFAEGFRMTKAAEILSGVCQRSEQLGAVLFQSLWHFILEFDRNARSGLSAMIAGQSPVAILAYPLNDLKLKQTSIDKNNWEQTLGNHGRLTEPAEVDSASKLKFAFLSPKLSSCPRDTRINEQYEKQASLVNFYNSDGKFWSAEAVSAREPLWLERQADLNRWPLFLSQNKPKEGQRSGSIWFLL